MSSSPQSFIELAAEGLVSPAEIDDFVDRWHDGDAGGQLHDYLGLTRSEYALWLVEPSMLGTIIKARTARVPLPPLVTEALALRRKKNAPEDADNAERLDRWLADLKTIG